MCDQHASHDFNDLNDLDHAAVPAAVHALSELLKQAGEDEKLCSALETTWQAGVMLIEHIIFLYAKNSNTPPPAPVETDESGRQVGTVKELIPPGLCV